MKKIISLVLIILLLWHKVIGQIILWFIHCPKCGYEYKRGEWNNKKHRSKYCRGR